MKSFDVHRGFHCISFLLCLPCFVTAANARGLATEEVGQSMDFLAPHEQVQNISRSEFSLTYGLAAVADKLDLQQQPWTWASVALVPLSQWVGSSQCFGIRTVLLCRLLVILTMNFTNKESVKMFPLWFLLSFQMTLQALLMAVWNRRNLRCGRWRDMRNWLLCLTPVWFLQLGMSLFAFKETSVSAIQILRSVMPVMSFVVEKTMYDDPETVSWKLVASMLVVVAGTALYGYSSISVTPIALMFVLLNCVFTVGSTVARRHFLKNPEFTVSLPMAMSSAAISMVPLTLVTACATGELAEWPSALSNASPTAWFLATMSGLVAGCFDMLRGRSQQTISATSDLMYQNLVKVMIIVMGIFMFSDSFTITSLFALAISFGGCAWYGYLRLSEKPGNRKNDMRADANTGFAAGPQSDRINRLGYIFMETALPHQTNVASIVSTTVSSPNPKLAQPLLAC